MNLIKAMAQGLSLMIVLLFSGSTSAQSNYVPATITMQSGEVVEGFVDDRNWGKNPGTMKFKASLNERPRQYSPVDIRVVSLPNDRYFSGIVQVETSPRSTSDLSTDPEYRFRSDTTFLQVVVEGPKTLMQYVDGSGAQHFYIMSDGTPELLRYKRYLKDVNGTKVSREKKDFVQQLVSFLASCEAVKSQINVADYRAQDMHDIFNAYYSCTSDEAVYQLVREKGNGRFGVIAGIAISSIDFAGQAFGYLVNADWSSSTDPMVGLSFEWIMARNNRKWSINNELIWTQYEITGRHVEFMFDDQHKFSDLTLNFAYVKLNNTLRFRYPLGGARIYLEAGLGNGFAIKDDTERRLDTKLLTSMSVEEGPALDETRSYEQSWLAGIGLDLDRFSVGARTEFGNGFSPFASVNASTLRIHVFGRVKF